MDAINYVLQPHSTASLLAHSSNCKIGDTVLLATIRAGSLVAQHISRVRVVLVMI